MRRFVLALLVLSLTSVMADRAHSGGSSIVGVLNDVGGSGVTGKVSLRSLGAKGTRISMSESGLQVDVEYISVYHLDGGCASFDMSSMSQVLHRYRGDKRGRASLTIEVPATIDQIHSVSVRLGNGWALVACAPLN